MKLQVINRSGMPLQYATDGSAGIDLPTGYIYKCGNSYYHYNTEVQVAIPEGHVGLLIPRSSLHQRGWALANQVGVIDSDYRGPIELVIYKTRDDAQFLNSYDRPVQLVIVPYQRVEIEEVGQLPETARGSGGFGSTGK